MISSALIFKILSYLEDPRVFLASERTLLAWIRTEISILALAFLLKKFGIENGSGSEKLLDSMIIGLCVITVLLSILAAIQSYLTMLKLDEIEIPGKMAKPLVLLAGFISVALSIGATAIILLIN